MLKVRTYSFTVLKIAIVALLLSIVSMASAQQDIEKKGWPAGWTAGGSYHTGTLLVHHNYMSILKEQSSWMVELYMAKQADGSQPWHSFFGYPDFGLKLSVIDLGSPTYMGKAYTLHPFMKFYLLKSNHRFRPSITASAGPAYVEKIFDRHSNYKNSAIGSHVNAFLQLQLDLNVRLTDNTYAFTGFALSHFSNGSFKKPNSGINIVTAKIGVGHSFKQPQKQPVVNGYQEAGELALRKWSYRAIVSGGLKRIDIGDDQHGVLSMSFEASRKHLAFTRFNGSFDVFYDGSDYHTIHNALYYDGNISHIQTTKLGLAAGYELLFGKTSTNFQLGLYLYAQQNESGIAYQRFTIRYMPIDCVGIQFGLKSHNAAADYIELGCIYRIR